MGIREDPLFVGVTRPAMAMGVTRIPEGLNRLEHHAVMVPGMASKLTECSTCFSGV